MVKITKTTGYSRKVQADRFEPVEVHETVTLEFDGSDSPDEIEQAVEEAFWESRANVERRLAEVLTELKTEE
ncbi:hypothetical protein [Halobellus limi]|uniref:Uncharacterized protein n=1 Tax=Halobellus limi TaxID=699433 RepID=A0A1H5ZFB0_9EURY|nr:hypothetical protein [Halobellus limi]QCC48121.1 hypothetical protein DV707_10860 [Halobellus limi]SEG34744.1 hypothetical protein SAMN04488133_1965 [Halobellus limi]